MICPVCKTSDEVQLSHLGPTETALHDVNPLEPYRCTECMRRFWRPKAGRRFFFSTCLALLFIALLVNAGIQIAAVFQGTLYRTADRAILFLNLDPSIRCNRCDSDDISRSTLRPKDRLVDWLNPFTPYRCWDCWHRFWQLKEPLEAATNLVLLALFGMVIIRGWRRDRKPENVDTEYVNIDV